ncbi:aspartate carbamoyltransferase catalytic subunit [Legionella londiniensis]|uniref:Aspartate carbamoyltransferase n=1 Tax=Legionella londiniensis TaxID=45068 RepID=A0A0W0VLU2_9GAMM|nr:aspartate carbamoyltransferase catalytic subunit [Legionella londiniensis]KTD21082.1 aspartate carbamoyltransferase [Legionella londiniensis]STX93658.1 Aspartate carbamoyltransferase (Aspartate transcarbamylase) (ATCase) [Legionella londiniensis]
MNHFLEINQLTREEAETLVQRALYFKHHAVYPDYSFLTVANLFYENSTRTRVSFELAAKQLQMKVINLDLQSSSENKGERIEDTVKTLNAMGISLFVIRHRQDGLPKYLANVLQDGAHIINAGDGQHAHPSQAMLDAMTIIEKKRELQKLKIAIVGDIKHSRVANSLQQIFSLFQVAELALVAPALWQPETVHYGQITDSLCEGLAGADVVICLRVQKERLLSNEHLELESYRQNFAITPKTLAYAKKDALLMHPGPINRGVELDNEVADGSQSCILQQVKNGVFMRMAILEAIGRSVYRS